MNALANSSQFKPEVLDPAIQDFLASIAHLPIAARIERVNASMRQARSADENRQFMKLLQRLKTEQREAEQQGTAEAKAASAAAPAPVTAEAAPLPLVNAVLPPAPPVAAPAPAETIAPPVTSLAGVEVLPPAPPVAAPAPVAAEAAEIPSGVDVKLPLGETEIAPALSAVKPMAILSAITPATAPHQKRPQDDPGYLMLMTFAALTEMYKEGPFDQNRDRALQDYIAKCVMFKPALRDECVANINRLPKHPELLCKIIRHTYQYTPDAQAETATSSTSIISQGPQKVEVHDARKEPELFLQSWLDKLEYTLPDNPSNPEVAVKQKTRAVKAMLVAFKDKKTEFYQEHFDILTKIRNALKTDSALSDEANKDEVFRGQLTEVAATLEVRLNRVVSEVIVPLVRHFEEKTIQNEAEQNEADIKIRRLVTKSPALARIIYDKLNAVPAADPAIASMVQWIKGYIQLPTEQPRSQPAATPVTMGGPLQSKHFENTAPGAFDLTAHADIAAKIATMGVQPSAGASGAQHEGRVAENIAVSGPQTAAR